MRAARGIRVEVGRWKFIVPESFHNGTRYNRDELIEDVVAALEGKRGAPFRRSRHATTWKVGVARPAVESTNIFVKKLDTARGLIGRAKAKSRAKRSEHVRRISEDLRRHDFRVPKVLLIGENRDTREEVIVTSQAAGFMLTRWVNPTHRVQVGLRHAILRQLGAELARLHLKGYIHGDLTPYNIFATDDHPIAITFIDHEGTEKISRVSINVARSRMRNLVQLGHFDLPGLSRIDQLRVFASYAAGIGLSRRARRQYLLRLAKMIARRRYRDRTSKQGAKETVIIAEEDAARS
jgi:serine/threonine protein kinase